VNEVKLWTPHLKTSSPGVGNASSGGTRGGFGYSDRLGEQVGTPSMARRLPFPVGSGRRAVAAAVGGGEGAGVLSAELVADLTDPTPTATRAGVHSMSRRAGDQLGGTADADRRFWKRFEEDSTLLRVLKRTALQRAPLECRAAGAHHLCRGRCTQPPARSREPRH